MIVLRYTDPERPRPFRVPFVHVVGIVGAVLCVFVMKGLPQLAWVRFGWWLVIGLVLYFRVRLSPLDAACAGQAGGERHLPPRAASHERLAGTTTRTTHRSLVLRRISMSQWIV